MGEFGPRSLKGVLSTEVRACVTMTHSSTIWIHLHPTGVRKTVLTTCCSLCTLLQCQRVLKNKNL